MKAETPGSQTPGRPEEPFLAPEPEEESAPDHGRRAGFRPHWLPRGVPRVLGGYVLLRLLGHGPRGRAFLARPISLDDPAVLKVLAADRERDPVFRARHVREAFAAAQIRHPNLIAIREVDAHRGHHYAAVEWVGGPSLDEVLHATPKIEPGRAAVMILQAARGLKAAHRQGLWHRDVKPANLRLDPAGLVRVDDLGLEMTPSLAAALEVKETARAASPLDANAPASVARAAGEPTASVPAVVGTPAFMAPEQAGDPLAADGRADIYALGGTFYNLVTGRPPFPGETAVELIRKHAEEPLVPPGEFVPGLPRKVSEVIRTMMGKSPEERYPSMDVVVDVLEGLLGLRTDAAAKELADAGETARQAAERAGRVAGAKAEERSPPRGRGHLGRLLALPAAPGPRKRRPVGLRPRGDDGCLRGVLFGAHSWLGAFPAGPRRGTGKRAEDLDHPGPAADGRAGTPLVARRLPALVPARLLGGARRGLSRLP